MSRGSNGSEGSKGDLSEALDALYETPPEEFVARRRSLVTALRRAGRTKEASELGSYRKPAVEIWAIRRVLRGDPEAWERLRRAGRDLRIAHRKALSAVSRHELQSKSESRRKLLDELSERAADALRSAGRDPGRHRAKIRETLDAVSLDENLARELADGRLTKPVSPPVGFGGFGQLRLVGK